MMEGMSAVGSAVAVALKNPTTDSLPPKFEHVASVASSTPASLDQAAASQRCSPDGGRS